MIAQIIQSIQGMMPRLCLYIIVVLSIACSAAADAQCALPSVNGDFETPVISPLQNQLTNQSSVPGWTTNDPQGKIEIWVSGFIPGGATVPFYSYSGNQFIEMNATAQDILTQQVATTPGVTIYINFAHMGRKGVDVMSVQAGPVGGPYTTLGTYSDGNTAWTFHSGIAYTIPTGQTTTQFNYVSVSQTGGNASVGNLLDAVSYTYTDSIPVITASAPSFCPNGSVTLSSTKGIRYHWNTGDTSRNLVVTTPGIYMDTVFYSSGCYGVSNTETITQKSPSADTVNASICQSSSYTFNGSTYSASGTYTATLTNKAGCDSVATLNLTVSHASVTNVTGTICAGRVYKLPKNDTTTQAGVYTDTLLNPAGCDSIIVTTLFVQQHGVVAGPDTSVCPGMQVQMFANSVSNSNYTWTPIDGLDYTDISTPIATVTDNVTYTVITTSPNGCLDTATVTINMYTLPIITISPDITIPLGSTTPLSVTGGAAYTWSPANTLSDAHSANPLATPLQNTQYTVTIISKDGCVLHDSVTVDVSDSGFVLVPTAFTPNGDGTNDILTVIARGDFRLNYFNIYDRWGELVFSTHDAKTGWDGTFRGQPEPISTYVYVLQGIGNGGLQIQKQGNITLLR